MLRASETKNLAAVPITDKTLLGYFEEVQRMGESDQQAVKTLLEALIIKNKMTGLISGREQEE